MQVRCQPARGDVSIFLTGGAELKPKMGRFYFFAPKIETSLFFVDEVQQMLDLYDAVRHRTFLTIDIPAVIDIGIPIIGCWRAVGGLGGRRLWRS